ncbi:MAG: hypothetical protein FWH37_08940 [Candidatus Bathyarchaeota archaeon]|nr:hypothetical protein [Candidatus Termiticorpusculum sp.]
MSQLISNSSPSVYHYDCVAKLIINYPIVSDYNKSSLLESNEQLTPFVTDYLTSESKIKTVPIFDEITIAKIEKAKNCQLPNKEYVQLFEAVAKVSIRIHKPEPDQYVAIRLTNSEIVAKAKSKCELVKTVRRMAVLDESKQPQLFIWKVNKE